VHSERERELVEREKKALSTLIHPNIVKLFEIIEDDDKDATYLIFEYVSGGELFNYIVSNGRLTETVARKFLRQIVSALEYCHFNLIVHRDLKPENLLLDENNNIKITDFGLANFITPNKFQTFCGSLHYAAPEILQGHNYGGPPVDVYALGIILYSLVNGHQPFDAQNPFEMIKRINQGLHFEYAVSKELRDLIGKMLMMDPKKRITLEEMRTHPWILKDFKEPPVTFVPKFKSINSIDEEIMKEIVALGFEDTPINRNQILKNKSKQLVSAYQLFLTRRKSSVPPSPIVEIRSPKAKKRLSSASIANPLALSTGLKRSHSHEEIGTEESEKNRKQLRESQKKNSLGEKDMLEMVEGKKEAVDDFDSLIKEKPPKPLVFKRRADNRASTSSTPNTPESKPKHQHELSLELNNQINMSLGMTTSGPDSPSLSASGGIEPRSADFQQRNLKLSSTFKCDTTSSKSTREIKRQIATAALKCALDCEKVSRYSFKLHKQDVKVTFDIEIVKMKDFKNLKGLKFKRLEGDIWQYKQVVTEFLDTLHL
jgi:serine/threonine protein kinase